MQQKQQTTPPRPASAVPDINRPWRTCDVMAWAGISRRQLGDLTRAGLIPARKIGNAWFYDPKKVAEFFDVGL